MSWEGLEGLDLTTTKMSENVILSPGKHVVKITEATIVSDNEKKQQQLQISYANDDGNIRQWLTVYNPSANEKEHDKQLQYGRRNFRILLKKLGHAADNAPHPDWLVGKTIGINVKDNVYNNKTKTEVQYFFDVDTEAGDQTSGDKKDDMEDAIPF